MLITDISLLLVMLVGLFRLRRRGSTFGLAQVLWKQVRLRFFVSCGLFDPLVYFRFVRVSFGSCSLLPLKFRRR